MTITNKDILSIYKEGTTVYDIINSIHEGASQGYQDYMPLASKETMAEMKHNFTINNQMLNEFTQALINKVGKTIITRLAVRQVLERFKKGTMAYGDTLEEVHVNLTKAHTYDKKRDEEEVFKSEDPDVRAMYHKLNRKEFYKTSIHETEVIRAFDSAQGVMNLISKIVSTLINSNRNDEYKYMKLLIESAFSQGAFHIVPVGDLETQAGQLKLLEKTREYSLVIQDINHFNPMLVDNATPLNEQYAILPASTSAKIDVNQLASAFNQDKKDFIAQRVQINYFANTDIYACLISEQFFNVLDQIFEVRSLPNPQNMKTNYWLHVHQVMSFSPFNTAIAFVKSYENDVVSVVTTPPVSVLYDEVDLMTTLKMVEGKPTPEYTVAWSTNYDEVTLTDIFAKDEDGADTTNVIGCKVTPKSTAIGGSTITITGKTTIGGKEHKTTAHIQLTADFGIK